MRILPWIYTAICWTLIGLAVIKEDWRYLYALMVVVLIFFTSLFCVRKTEKTTLSP